MCIRDRAYAAFGKVVEGMDVVNKIAETATDYSDRPSEEQRMEAVSYTHLDVYKRQNLNLMMLLRC